MHRACLALPNSLVFSLKMIETWWSFQKVLIFPFLLLSVEKKCFILSSFFFVISVFILCFLFFWNARASNRKNDTFARILKFLFVTPQKWPTTISNGFFRVISEKTVIYMRNYYFDTYRTICFFIYSKSMVFVLQHQVQMYEWIFSNKIMYEKGKIN